MRIVTVLLVYEVAEIRSFHNPDLGFYENCCRKLLSNTHHTHTTSTPKLTHDHSSLSISITLPFSLFLWLYSLGDMLK